MAHELACNADGSAKMAYFGAAPWHRLGTPVDHAMTSEEAWRLAGFDYTVALEPLQTVSGLPVDDRFAVVRSDNQAVLGTVGGTYEPIQNHEAFGFLDALVQDGQLQYHTAGALGKGERVWMLARLPGDIVVKDIDVTNKYLLLSMGHDGLQAMRVHYTSVRVVCNNTLTMASRQAGNSGAWIQHRGDMQRKFMDAQRVLGLASRFFDDLESRIQKLVAFNPTYAQVTGYFKGLYPDPQPRPGHAGDEERERVAGLTRGVKKTRSALLGLFEGGLGNGEDGIRHTGWAMVNAVTEYIDHRRSGSNPSSDDRAEKRMAANWFGQGAATKVEAFDSAYAMAEVN